MRLIVEGGLRTRHPDWEGTWIKAEIWRAARARRINVISRIVLVVLVVMACACPLAAGAANAITRRTTVTIDKQSFLINGEPTYKGRVFEGVKVEGLLLNARMVQGIFDDSNPETRGMWAYPDGTAFDAERNTREFVAAMPEWRRWGLVSFTINLQGGSPQGYSKAQPWHNSAFTETGELRPEYLGRLERILDRADELGMAPIVGLFYFGQAKRLRDEAAVVRATENTVDWLTARGYANVLVEVANEANQAGYPAILRPARAAELIELVKRRSAAGRVKNAAGRLYVSTSLTGGQVPGETITRNADFLLLHGNGQGQPARIRDMVKRTRAAAGYRGQPILFNEDDHFAFDKAENNFTAAVAEGAGWGYFDYRQTGEGFDEGYQSVPVNWGMSSERKRGFFELLGRITGAKEKEHADR